VSSPKTSPQRGEGFVVGGDQAGSFVSGRDQLEEQVGGVGFERDVADFVDDQEGVAAECAEFVVEAAGVVGVGESGDPVGGGGEQGAVPAWQALIPIPTARCVLPVPGGPSRTTFSFATTGVPAG